MTPVKIIQTHNATVVETEEFNFPTNMVRQLINLSMPDREFFIREHGTSTFFETEIADIHETKNVSIEWHDAEGDHSVDA